MKPLESRRTHDWFAVDPRNTVVDRRLGAVVSNDGNRPHVKLVEFAVVHTPDVCAPEHTRNPRSGPFTPTRTCGHDKEFFRVRTDTVVSAKIRDTRGKNEARRTRRSGLIPGVVYGAFKDAVSVAVDPKAITKILRSKTGHNTIFNVQVDGGETTPVMVVDEQYDPVKSYLLHVDMKRIDLTKRIRVSVPVHTTGEPVGVKTQGGLLEVVTRFVEIETLPDEIPESYTIDVTELSIGQNRRASDIQLSSNTKLTSSPDTVIAHVVGMRAEEAKPAAEAGTAVAEPEVVKKGKKEEEGAAPAAGADKAKKK
jgi:large subunit ribosomal protein L25